MEHHEVPVQLGAARGEAGTGRSAPGRAEIVAARPGGRLDDDSRHSDGSSGTCGILFTGSGQQLSSSWWSVASVLGDGASQPGEYRRQKRGPIYGRQ